MQELLTNDLFPLFLGVVIGTVIGFFGAKYLFSGSTTGCSGDYSLTRNKIISFARAKEMFDSYTDNRVGIIQAAEDAGFEPTRFGSLDFNVLKNYVEYLCCIDEKMKVASEGIQSVRIYFANYPEESRTQSEAPGTTIGGIRYSYARQNTTFLLPTMIDGQGEEKGFRYSGDLSSPNFSPLENFDAAIDTAAMDTKQGSLILNEVGLTPPPPGQYGDFGL